MPFDPLPVLRPATFGVLLIGLLISASATANIDLKDRHLELIDPAKMRQLSELAARRHLADYPDGGYIADINGRNTALILRPGMKVAINGKGFAQRAQASNVGLFAGAATSGMLLNIISWSDTRVIVVVSSDPARLIPASNQVRMILQGVKAGNVWSRYEVENIRFIRS